MIVNFQNEQLPLSLISSGSLQVCLVLPPGDRLCAKSHQVCSTRCGGTWWKKPPGGTWNTRFVAPGVEAGREHHAAPLCHRSLHPGQVGGQNQNPEHVGGQNQSQSSREDLYCKRKLKVQKITISWDIASFLYLFLNPQDQCDPCPWDQSRTGKGRGQKHQSWYFRMDIFIYWGATWRLCTLDAKPQRSEIWFLESFNATPPPIYFFGIF